MDRYENCVLNALSYVLPEWIEEDNKKFQVRYAKWAEAYSLFKIQYEAWKERHTVWEAGEKDPMLEPIEPANPSQNVFGDLEPAKPFSIEVRNCKVNGSWKPINLHHVILKFLHRRQFFKHFEIEVIESYEGAEQLEPELPGSQEQPP